MERKLEERAAQRGLDINDCARQLIEEGLNGGQRGEVARSAEGGPAKSLKDILAPIHEEFRKSGMTEAELDALIEECREEVWQEQQGRKRS